MHFENSPRDRDFLNRVKAFINEEIEPVEAAYWREVASTCPSSDWKQWRSHPMRPPRRPAEYPHQGHQGQ